MTKSLLRAILVLMAICSFYKSTAADTDSDSVHVVIAVDQSSSMFNDWPSHNEITRRGLTSFLESYIIASCAKVTIDYIAWGTTQTPPLTIARNGGPNKTFITSMQDLSFVDQGSTMTNSSLAAAVKVLNANPANEELIIIVTDGLPDDHPTSGLDFNQTVDLSIRLTAITFGTTSVQRYTQQSLLRPDDSHFHVQNEDQFKEALAAIFAELPLLNEICVG